MPNNTSLEIEAANAGLLAPTATDLMCMFENGEDDKAKARIRTLGQENYIEILRAVQRLESALSDYALSWSGSEYWGRGTNFPDGQRA